jgi:hypothetical protein
LQQPSFYELLFSSFFCCLLFFLWQKSSENFHSVFRQVKLELWTIEI